MLNPLQSIVKSFEIDDFVVVKLDIDHSETEMSLVSQILDDEELFKKIDQFYFEHHVNMFETANFFGKVSGTVETTMNLFLDLRKNNIASHFWV